MRFPNIYDSIIINTKVKDGRIMGNLDALTKEYMKRPDIFADVFNQFLYHGSRLLYQNS